MTTSGSGVPAGSPESAEPVELTGAAGSVATAGSAVPDAPGIRISGGATPAETAAIVAVLTSMGAPAPVVTPRRTWGSPSSQMRTMPAPGVHAWRASALPR